MFKKSLVLILPCLLTACASTPFDYATGTQVSNQQLQSYAVKTSSLNQQNIIDELGHPNRKNGLNGKEIWYYDYTKIGALGGSVSESTVFEWSSKGVLLRSYKSGKVGQTGNPLLDAANGG